MSEIRKVDGTVVSVEMMTDEIKEKMEAIAVLLQDTPESLDLVKAAWSDIEQLANVNVELNALMAGMWGAMEEAIAQRDGAVEKAAEEKMFAEMDKRTWQKNGAELAKRILAGQIAIDADIPVTDVQRVLDVLSGDKSTLEEYGLTGVYTAIAELGEYLFEEQVYEAAESDGESDGESDE